MDEEGRGKWRGETISNKRKRMRRRGKIICREIHEEEEKEEKGKQEEKEEEKEKTK